MDQNDSRTSAENFMFHHKAHSLFKFYVKFASHEMPTQKLRKKTQFVLLLKQTITPVCIANEVVKSTDEPQSIAYDRINNLCVIASS